MYVINSFSIVQTNFRNLWPKFSLVRHLGPTKFVTLFPSLRLDRRSTVEVIAEAFNLILSLFKMSGYHSIIGFWHAKILL